jgi:hypothetical protein
MRVTYPLLLYLVYTGISTHFFVSTAAAARRRLLYFVAMLQQAKGYR